MLAGPLVLRELREQARRPLTHWLRMLGAVAVCAMTVHMAGSMVGAMLPGFVIGPGSTLLPVSQGGAGVFGSLTFLFGRPGGPLFDMMNLVLLGAVWLVAPLTTADALSRERREGTLGLLFLTPLRARDIVLAKLAAHALRAGGVLLGAAPVLMLPMLMGGVSWIDVARAVLIDLGALLLALTAGLLASTWWQGPRAVLFGALGVALGLAAAWLAGGALLDTGVAVWRGTVPDVLELLQQNVVRRFSFAWWNATALISNPAMYWLGRGLSVGPNPVRWRGIADLMPAAGLLGVALVLMLVVFRLAARSVVRSQREGRPAGVGTRTVEWLGRARFLGRLQRQARAAALRREPVLWTEFRTWRLRVGIWLMVLGMVPFLTSWVAGGAIFGRVEQYQLPLLALSGMLALAAASGLHTERTSGVLELLLTVPRGERRLIAGKVAGLMLQSAPSVVLFGTLGIAMLATAAMVSFGRQNPIAWAVSFLVSLLARMALVIHAGLLFSLWMRAHFPALLATLGVAGAADALRRAIVVSFAGENFNFGNIETYYDRCRAGQLFAAVVEGLLAIGFVFLLHRALARRSFVPRSASTG